MKLINNVSFLANDFNYLTKNFKKRLLPNITTPDQEKKLMHHIKSIVNVIIFPWISTTGKSLRELTLLDIGCGDGKYGYFLKDMVGHYIGIDIREHSIKEAKKLLNTYKNCKILKGDGYSLSQIPDNSVDLIFSYQTFIHFPSKEIVINYFSEIHRVLKENGQAKIQLMGPEGRDSIRIGWIKLGFIIQLIRSKNKYYLKLLENFIQKLFPLELLVPIIRIKKIKNQWGEIGGVISPLETINYFEKINAQTFIMPSYVGSYYSSHDKKLYWAYISKNNKKPFVLEIG